MKISYNKLWKLLIDKKMRQSDLRRAASIAPNTLTRLYRDQEVKLEVLYRICRVLNADIGDIMEFLPDAEESDQGLAEKSTEELEDLLASSFAENTDLDMESIGAILDVLRERDERKTDLDQAWADFKEYIKKREQSEIL